ncbi:precorrin-6A synthase (deacetylating) [Mesorhizobium xinjiangense]|uniref:precorrin-6A synthase (deacetylating) n=1 Tax=Mesorhizobium xinjiangense TaxID=2678685 RepID=UPI0012ED98CF|nr:precorrin-6A synthase (deacetylating) [Mesorhizobium xinjiangense]
MRHLLVIGIGAGDPEHLTVQAINALNRADVIFIPDKGAEKASLAKLRREICARFINRPYRSVPYAVPTRRKPESSYNQTVDGWHEAIAGIYERLLSEELKDGETGAFLVWGDPSIYDSTLRIIERVRRTNKVAFDHEVIPGITSIQALAAKHRIALNTIGGAVHITTGRKLAEDGAQGSDSVVVMLDGQCAFKSLPAGEFDIYWGANLGMPSETAVAGPLDEVGEQIERRRSHAREQEGWVMDSYLLRRREPNA